MDFITSTMQCIYAVCKFIEPLFWVAVFVFDIGIIVSILFLPYLPPVVELLIWDENLKKDILELIEQGKIRIANYYLYT